MCGIKKNQVDGWDLQIFAEPCSVYNDFIDAGSSHEAPFVAATKDQWKMF